MILAKFGLSIGCDYFLPYAGDVYRLTLSAVSSLPSYYATWGTDSTYTTETFSIGDVLISYNDVQTSYSPVASIADCQTTDESFYFDFTNQILYCNFAGINPAAGTATLYDITGYTNEETVYIDDQEYAPFLLNVPSISKSVDPLKVNRMSFPNQTINLINSTGEQDKFIDEPIPGLTLELIDYDPDTGTQTSIYTGYITSDSYSMDEARFIEADSRQSDNVPCPVDTISTHLTAAGYSTADLPTDTGNKITPNIYGSVKGAPCYCTNADDESASCYTFIAGHYISTLSTVYVKGDDDRWSSVSTYSTDLDNGIFVLTAANCRNASNKILDVKADLTGVALTNPADIIEDLNSRFLGIAYNSYNYETANWPTEKALIGGSSYLYMDSTAELFTWIEELQNAGERQFLYDITPDGKRTLRVYYQNRDETFWLHNWQLIDSSGERDFQFYASTVTVEYAKDFKDSTVSTVSNTDYSDDRIDTYGQEIIYTVSADHAGLDNVTDATTKARNIAEKYTPEMVFTIEVFIDDANFFDDIRLWSTGFIYFEDEDRSRTYFGDRHVIVEGIDFDLDNRKMRLTCRNREVYYFLESGGGYFRTSDDERIKVAF